MRNKLSCSDAAGLKSPNSLPQDIQQAVFPEIKSFNRVQSAVFDDLVNSDNSVAVCAPTGCGKTLLMELSIVRLLTKLRESSRNSSVTSCSVVYIAPMKSLCSERYEDWRSKFCKIGLTTAMVTGDTEDQDIQKALKCSIIVTTPEKWENVTRCLSAAFFNFIQLYLIDEIHMLSDVTRGPTLEVLIARTKAANVSNGGSNRTRFVAVSATCPNMNEVATWLGTARMPAVSFNFDKTFRPVPLELIVLGYPYSG